MTTATQPSTKPTAPAVDLDDDEDSVYEAQPAVGDGPATEQSGGDVPATFTGLPAIPTLTGLAGSVATLGGLVGATTMPAIVATVAVPAAASAVTATAGAVLLMRSRRRAAEARMPGGRRGLAGRMAGGRFAGLPGQRYRGFSGDTMGSASRRGGSGRGVVGMGSTSPRTGSGRGAGGGRSGSAIGNPSSGTAARRGGAFRSGAVAAGSATQRAAARVANRAAALPGAGAVRRATAPALSAARSARSTIGAAARRAVQSPRATDARYAAKQKADTAKYAAKQKAAVARDAAKQKTRLARDTARQKAKDTAGTWRSARAARRERRANTVEERAEKRMHNWARLRRVVLRTLAAVPVIGVGVVGGALGLTFGLITNMVSLFNRDVPFNGKPLFWGWNWARSLWGVLTGRMSIDEFERLLGVDDPDDDNENLPEAGEAGGGGADEKERDVSVFARECEQVAEAYLRYSPPSMLAVAAEYKGVPGACRSTATALYALATNTASVYAAEKEVAEQIEGLADLMLKVATAADEIYPRFTTLHEHDLMRHDAPRNGFSGERMWNIGGVPGDGGSGILPSVMETAAEGVATTYSRYAPPTMMAVGREYEGLPVGLEALAQAVGCLAANSEANYPVHDTITEMVGNIYRLLVQVAAQAASITPAFRRAHAEDIARHEEPRKGREAEMMWNV